MTGKENWEWGREGKGELIVPGLVLVFASCCQLSFKGFSSEGVSHKACTKVALERVRRTVVVVVVQPDRLPACLRESLA